MLILWIRDMLRLDSKVCLEAPHVDFSGRDSTEQKFCTARKSKTRLSLNSDEPGDLRFHKEIQFRRNFTCVRSRFR